MNRRNDEGSQQHSFLLGDKAVDPLRNEINGVRVDGKAMQVLLALKDAYPNVLSSQELLDTVWPDVVVNDNVVHQALANLRKALNDDAKAPHVIETLPRKGYRLIADPAVAEQSSALRRAALFAGLALAAGLLLWFVGSRQEQEMPWGKIAVMDLNDLSPQQDLEWLAQGISSDIRSRLQGQGFDVHPGGLTQGRRLTELPGDVQLAIHGNLQADGNVVAVDIEVIDLRSGEGLWSESFDGMHPEPLSLQNQIATQIARYLGATVGYQPIGPEQPEAQAAFLKYQFYQGGGDNDLTLHWLGRTLELAPKWAHGWAIYANTLLYDAQFRRVPLDVARVEEAIGRAKELGNPSDWVVGSYKWYVGDLRGAEEALRQASLRGDSENYLRLMHASGLVREVIRARERMLLDMPYNAGTADSLSFAHAELGNLRAAYEASQYCMRLLPPPPYRCMFGTAWALPRLGRTEEAQALLGELEEARQQLQEGVGTYGLLMGLSGVLRAGMALHDNDLESVSRIADELAAQNQVERAVLMHLEAGRVDRARRILSEQFDLSRDRPWHWHVDRALTSEQVRQHPVFREFTAMLGFTDAWRLELCERASTMPSSTYISCDPLMYQEQT